ncbi:MAG TPA: MotA/TolQ/ExbB proton channel family protein [Azospirillaceae bacterium]|nr:MotA/TolQ/ExbB proton channel family protein [Azospirillaceae bacterium]
MARSTGRDDLTTRLSRGRTSVDLATALGLGGSFALVVAAMALGGAPKAFFDLPSVMIVLGGTVGVTMVSFSMGDLAGVLKVLSRTLVHAGQDARAVARQLLLLAEAARRTDPERLKALLPEFETRADPFLLRCVTLITDGLPPDDIDRVLAGEVEALSSTHAKTVSVLRRAAEVAPAMGLIGTLVGLVQMLGHLNDPSTIGPAMAVALLTTFYGAVLGNMALLPLAGKLERNAEEEALVRNLYRVGAVSIARQENPRRLEMLLNAALPPGQRIQYFDR